MTRCSVTNIIINSFNIKNKPEFMNELREYFGDFYLIPEGGSNAFAVKGCKEIINHIPFNADFICCAVGTGGTISGIHLSLNKNQEAIGIPVLKNAMFLENEIKKINYAKTVSYNFISKKTKLHPRHVGRICGQNRLLLFIPCHRVIRSSGLMGGFSAKGGVNLKNKILKFEKLNK